MGHEVHQEFSIPDEHYTGSLRIDSRCYPLAMVAIRGLKQGPLWEVGAYPCNTGKDKVKFGEILIEPDIPPESVLPETEKWIRRSGDAIWLPNHIKPLSSGSPSITVGGLLAVCKLKFEFINSLSTLR